MGGRKLVWLLGSGASPAGTWRLQASAKPRPMAPSAAKAELAEISLHINPRTRAAISCAPRISGVMLDLSSTPHVWHAQGEIMQYALAHRLRCAQVLQGEETTRTGASNEAMAAAATRTSQRAAPTVWLYTELMGWSVHAQQITTGLSGKVEALIMTGSGCCSAFVVRRCCPVTVLRTCTWQSTSTLVHRMQLQLCTGASGERITGHTRTDHDAS